MIGMRTIVISLIALLFTSCSRYEYYVQKVYADSTIDKVNALTSAYISNSSQVITNVNNSSDIKVKNKQSGNSSSECNDVGLIKKELLRGKGKSVEGLLFVDPGVGTTFIPYYDIPNDLKPLFEKLKKRKIND